MLPLNPAITSSWHSSSCQLCTAAPARYADNRCLLSRALSVENDTLDIGSYAGPVGRALRDDQPDATVVAGNDTWNVNVQTILCGRLDGSCRQRCSCLQASAGFAVWRDRVGGRRGGDRGARANRAAPRLCASLVRATADRFRRRTPQPFAGTVLAVASTERQPASQFRMQS